MSEEIWREVVGYEGLYRVSSLGRVIAYPKAVAVGVRGGVDLRPARELKPGRHPNGHLRVWLARDGRKSGKWLHRLVAEAFLPNPNRWPLVNHRDGNPANNRLENLEWATHQYNTQDGYDRGTHQPAPQHGVRNGQCRLTEETVRAMRRCFAETGNSAEVARRFGTTPKHTYDIVHGRKWAHLKG